MDTFLAVIAVLAAIAGGLAVLGFVFGRKR
jgi:hypothetical protein